MVGTIATTSKRWRWSWMVEPAPFLRDHPEILPVSNQDGVRHSQKQPGAYHARNRTDVSLQPSRIRNWDDLAIENMIAVVRHEHFAALKVGDRRKAKFGQSSGAQ